MGEVLAGVAADEPDVEHRPGTVRVFRKIVQNWLDRHGVYAVAIVNGDQVREGIIGERRDKPLEVHLLVRAHGLLIRQ